MEEANPRELEENLEHFKEHQVPWSHHLALSTTVIAVIAALASLQAGIYANQALVQKNEAVLLQAKASDQYSYYEAKGIKKNLAQAFFEHTQNDRQQAEAERYDKEQSAIKAQADVYSAQEEIANEQSQHLFEKHHQAALSITFFQIAIALSAMSAVLARKSLWLTSLAASTGGIAFLLTGILR